MSKSQRFVQAGRVVLVNYGQDTGKLAVIVDILDARRAIIEGPQVTRRVENYKRLTLTPLLIAKFPRACGSQTVQKLIASNDILAKWEKTSWAKKLAQKEKKAQQNDFDRFKVMIAKKQRRTIVNKELRKVKKSVKA